MSVLADCNIEVCIEGVFVADVRKAVTQLKAAINDKLVNGPIWSKDGRRVFVTRESRLHEENVRVHRARIIFSANADTIEQIGRLNMASSINIEFKQSGIKA